MSEHVDAQRKLQQLSKLRPTKIAGDTTNLQNGATAAATGHEVEAPEAVMKEYQHKSIPQLISMSLTFIS